MYLNKIKYFLFILLFIFLNFNLYAVEPVWSRYNVNKILMGLIGGLALFLFGIDQMSSGLKRISGKKMRHLLARLTRNRFIALLVGTFFTVIVQSSSATTVILVSFVHAGLMKFGQTLGIILGAHIGTTVTSQLVAFKLTEISLLAISIGFLIRMTSKGKFFKNFGDAILGFGLIFYGMKLMSFSILPFRDSNLILPYLKFFENPFLGVLVGTIGTAIIQSSAAFIGIIIVMARQELISLEAGITLIMGANIGTCITAILASIGSSKEAKRVAVAHTLFKVIGVAIFIFWIPEYARIVEIFSSKFNSDLPRTIAHAHTFFNLGLVILILPFTPFFEKLIIKLTPFKSKQNEKFSVKHLDDNLLKTPALAIHYGRLEIARMAKVTAKMIDEVIHLIIPDSESKLSKNKTHNFLYNEIKFKEEKVNFLEKKVSSYLLSIGKNELSDQHSSEVYKLITIANDLESIGDIIYKEIYPLVIQKEEKGCNFSIEGQEELKKFHSKISKQIHRLEMALKELDPERASKVHFMMKRYNDLESELMRSHLERVYLKRKESVDTHRIHTDIIDKFKQINVYTGNIAKTITSLCSD